MGIKNLWQILDPLKSSQSLQLYATEHRKRADALGLTGPRLTTLTLGVDMGLWMAECNAGSLIGKTPYSSQQTAGGGLYLFFKRLTELQKTPVFFVFVLDGPDRPARKRGHIVIHRRLWWERRAVQFIRAFGYTVHEAPGDAEAELARFCVHGLVDGAVTNDSDACVFGAGLILRRVQKRVADFDGQYDVYDFRAASEKPGLPLSRGSSLLIALLCGGDYDDGVEDCAHSTAFALARCGYGDTLREAFLSLSEPAFQDFARLWREQLRMELYHNYQGHLSCINPAAASKIKAPFPMYDVIQKYVCPITSWSPGYHIPTSNDWSAITPALYDIAQLCKRCFEWEDLRDLKGKFEQHVLEGICLQLLYSPHLDHPRNPTNFSMANGMSMSVIRLRYEQRRGQYARLHNYVPQPKLQVSTGNLIRLMAGSTDEDMSRPSDSIILHPPDYYVCNVHHIVSTMGPKGKTSESSPLLRKLDEAFGDASSSYAKRGKTSSSGPAAATSSQPRQLGDVIDLTSSSGPATATSSQPRQLGDVIDLTQDDAYQGDVIDLTQSPS